MARPIRLNADYFSHDSDMRNSRTMKALRAKFGLCGYAIWMMLLESITDSDEFMLAIGEIDIELIAADFGCEIEIVIAVYNYLVHLDLLQIHQINGKNHLSCKKLVDRLDPLISKRKRQRSVVIDSDNTSDKELSSAITQNKIVIADENTQSKVKESKVNKKSSSSCQKKTPDPQGDAAAASLSDFLEQPISKQVELIVEARIWNAKNPGPGEKRPPKIESVPKLTGYLLSMAKQDENEAKLWAEEYKDYQRKRADFEAKTLSLDEQKKRMDELERSAKIDSIILAQFDAMPESKRKEIEDAISDSIRADCPGIEVKRFMVRSKIPGFVRQDANRWGFYIPFQSPHQFFK